MSSLRPETLLSSLGNHPDRYDGIVNTPVHRASTILFKTLADFESAERGEYTKGPTYARQGTASSRALEEAICALEGAEATFTFASGESAIVTALLAFVQSGDHLLMVDAVYGPARKFCEQELKRFGVEITYYDPTISPDELRQLMRKNTRVVYMESPGSLTFEVMDIPALAAVAHEAGAVVIADCTWATPYFYQPFSKGVDVSIHSGTKYISGHSDLILGVLSTRKPHLSAVARTVRNIGACAAPDVCFLALRGLRTMAVRLKQHHECGLKIAQWLQKQPEVVRVMHPALPDHPQHALWKRDYAGASGLFSFMLQPCSQAKLAAMIDELDLFGMGYSWGGYESLLVPVHPENHRSARKWTHDGWTLRLHAGLEHPEDLIADLDRGFARLRAAA